MSRHKAILGRRQPELAAPRCLCALVAVVLCADVPRWSSAQGASDSAQLSFVQVAAPSGSFLSGPLAGARVGGVAVAHPQRAEISSSAAAQGTFVVAAATALLALIGAGAARARAASGRSAAGASVIARRSRQGNATPQQVPVLNMDGKQIGEETMHFHTLSEETANYVVHGCMDIWGYQQHEFTAFVPRRSDLKKGKKPWGQKGSGKARAGSRASPLFGKSATNKAPHGLDNRRNKRDQRHRVIRAISTVLQSKWRCMKIIDGLEDWQEARQKELEQCLRNWTDLEPGQKSMLMITRSGYGEMHRTQCIPTDKSYNSPLYMSGRLIPRLAMRRPRDIDPMSDGLKQCLKGRRLIVSREAFFDLKAKFNKEEGWALKSERQILVEQLQSLIKDHPSDRYAEIEAAREIPRSQNAREFWAKEQRDEIALAEGV